MWCAVVSRRRGRNVAGRGSTSDESAVAASGLLGAGFRSGPEVSEGLEGRGTEARNGDAERGSEDACPR